MQTVRKSSGYIGGASALSRLIAKTQRWPSIDLPRTRPLRSTAAGAQICNGCKSANLADIGHTVRNSNRWKKRKFCGFANPFRIFNNLLDIRRFVVLRIHNDCGFLIQNSFGYRQPFPICRRGRGTPRRLLFSPNTNAIFRQGVSQHDAECSSDGFIR